MPEEAGDNASDAVEAYLTDTKYVSSDAQGRVTLPADFRRAFEREGGRICLFPVEGSVWGFTPAAHARWVESFFSGGYNPRSRRDVRLRRALNAGTVTVDIDKGGRVALGKVGGGELVARAKASKASAADGGEAAKAGEVAVLGNDDHLEFWVAGEWKLEERQLDGDLPDMMFDQE